MGKTSNKKSYILNVATQQKQIAALVPIISGEAQKHRINKKYETKKISGV